MTTSNGMIYLTYKPTTVWRMVLNGLLAEQNLSSLYLFWFDLGPTSSRKPWRTLANETIYLRVCRAGNTMPEKEDSDYWVHDDQDGQND